jgi:hypothetical protein
MKTANVATSSTGYNSPVFWFGASAYNSSTAAAVPQQFSWQAVVSGNNTPTPTANLSLLAGSGGSQSPTGFSISEKGVINFVASQTFPITGTGGGTITGITTTSPLTGSGTSGSVALGLNQSALVSDIEPALNGVYAQLAASNTFAQPITFAPSQTFPGAGTITGISVGSGLTGGGSSGSVALGIDGTVVPLLAAANTFTAGQVIEGSTTITGTNISGSMLAVSNSGDSFSTGISVSNGGQYGIGLSASASSDGYGIEGFGTQTGGSIGVLGALANSNGFSNSFFLLESDDGLDSGVWADGATGQEAALIATGDDVYAGIFYNDSATSSTILALNNNSGGTTGLVAKGIGTVIRAAGPGGMCGINQTGNLACTGQVKAVISTKDGSRQLETYSVQSAENWVEDYGSGQLNHGAATIQIDAAFSETVNTGVDFHVFLTPGGDCKGLYVTNKTPGSFEVHELGAGTSSIPFDYKIVARRNGMEDQRLVDVTERMAKEGEAARLKALDHPLPRNRSAHPQALAGATIGKTAFRQ